MEGMPKKRGFGEKLRAAVFGAGALAGVAAESPAQAADAAHFTTLGGPWKVERQQAAPQAPQLPPQVEVRPDLAMAPLAPEEVVPAPTMRELQPEAVAAPLAPLEAPEMRPLSDVQARPLGPQ